MTQPLGILTNIARQLLDAQPDVSRDRAVLRAAVDQTVPIVERLTGHAFGAEELDSVVAALETVYVVDQGRAVALADRRENRAPEWYVGERRRPGPFFSRYLQKLREDGWGARPVDELRDSTARVLELLDDPDRDGPWSWKGLVVGDVQSGKTAHYSGVINRAVDAGYRLVIVLAGMHNVLRLQTQQRLEGDFLGFDTDPQKRVDGRRPAVGVGRIPPRLPAGSLTFAAPNGDFNVAFARQANFTPGGEPCLLVVKKNAAILKNLNDWFIGLPKAFRGAPLLLIDDEADQASIDTRDQPTLSDGTFAEDYEPTRVNGQIRRLLGTFERSAYVGYTATPFANILIHDERSAKVYGADLFPSTFIMSLSAPDDYFGPVAVFGTNDDDGAPELDVVRYLDQSAEGWMPDVHDRSLHPLHTGRDEAPPSLKVAIEDFLIACAARAARGQDRAHNSMLVHVSRFVDVHDHVHRQVERYLDEVRNLISGGDVETLGRLRARWGEDFEPTRASMRGTVFDRNVVDVTWEDVLARLADSSDRIQVVVANGRSKTGLDYDRYRDSGLSVIAIGGDKLSRGLTLEGLTVSYFLRISKQYDSLLQMGRWFGYRRGFADLCRLHTTPDMEDWFRHVATASRDLRDQLAHMRLMLKTPREYGLRVEAHSDMNVTAPNKQRHAVETRAGYGGEGKIQTVMFREDGPLSSNADATDAFLRSLGTLAAFNPPRPGGGAPAQGRLWNAEGRSVASFLRALRLPDENVDIHGERMAAYIEEQLGRSPAELTDWTVFVPEGDGRPVDLAGERLRSVERTPLPKRAAEARFVVKSILNPADEAIDLTSGQFAAALERTSRARAEAGLKPSTRPSGPEIREERDPARGLLIIYPMDPETAGAQIASDRPVIGVVVSFPSSETASDRAFVENTVLQREQAAG